MSAVPSARLFSLAARCGAGRFVPHVRNQPIGFESARIERGSGGVLSLRAETEIRFRRLVLRQSVSAEFDGGLAPRWCAVESVVNERPSSLHVEILRDHAVVVSRSGRDTRSARVDLKRPPLLLLDNAFVSHALAAVAAADEAAPPEYLSLPAGEPMTATRGPASGVWLGGRVYERPSVTLHLTPDLDEHVWLRDGWIERMILSPMQMRVEWNITFPSTGGRS